MLKFILKYMNIRKGRHIFTAITLLITLVTSMLVFNVSQQLTNSVMKTYQYYDVIIGPGGSQTQLLMNSLFYTDHPVGLLNYSVYQDLMEDARVATVIPVASGDSYNSVPIIGTEAEFLSDYPGEGRLWAQSYEVVLGYNAAHSTGLELESVFHGTHGLGLLGHVHEGEQYTVVGILNKTGSAIDNAIFCDITTVWEAHAEENEKKSASESATQTSDGISVGFEVDPIEGMWSQTIPDAEIANIDDLYPESSEEVISVESGIEEPEAGMENNKITAAIIKSKSIQDCLSLISEYNSVAGLQAINPSMVMRGILSNIGTATKIAVILCSVVLLMGVIVMITISALNIYDMKNDLKLLRLIGIPQWKVESIIYMQTVVITIVAIVAGLILSRALMPGINLLLSSTGITLTAGLLTGSDLLISLMVLLLNIVSVVLLTKYTLRGGMLHEKK